MSDYQSAVIDLALRDQMTPAECRAKAAETAYSREYAELWEAAADYLEEREQAKS